MEFPDQELLEGTLHSIQRDGGDLMIPMYIRVSPDGTFYQDARETYKWLHREHYPELPEYESSKSSEVGPGGIIFTGAFLELQVGEIRVWGQRITVLGVKWLLVLGVLSFLMGLAGVLLGVLR